MTRVVVGISGASGAVYGVRLLRALADAPDVETHLVVSRAGERTIAHELDIDPTDVRAWADVWYPDDDIGAAIASGSFRADAMAIAPCSIKTLSAVANSYSDSLLTRAADVFLKERRRLVLVVRETPLHLGHLKLMTDVTSAGAVVLPPVPSLYMKPQTVDQVIDHTVMKVCDTLGLHVELAPRWSGMPEPH
jgi:4-hydroxy-3-polyprenylbenzoate decarboxylase